MIHVNRAFEVTVLNVGGGHSRPSIYWKKDPSCDVLCLHILEAGNPNDDANTPQEHLEIRFHDEYHLDEIIAALRGMKFNFISPKTKKRKKS
jgi:hypothetical protein